MAISKNVILDKIWILNIFSDFTIFILLVEKVKCALWFICLTLLCTSVDFQKVLKVCFSFLLQPCHPAFIENIPHLCKHLDFNTDESSVKTLVGSLLNLMEDPDKDVRVAFSNCIKNILESLDSEEGFVKEVNLYLFLGFVPNLLWFLFMVL